MLNNYSLININILKRGSTEQRCTRRALSWYPCKVKWRAARGSPSFRWTDNFYQKWAPVQLPLLGIQVHVFHAPRCSRSMSAEHKTCQYLQGSIPQNTATLLELGGGRLKINPLQKPTWRGEFTDAYTLIVKCDRHTDRKEGRIKKKKKQIGQQRSGSRKAPVICLVNHHRRDQWLGKGAPNLSTGHLPASTNKSKI